MKLIMLFFAGAIGCFASSLDNATCAKCHPKIVKEYEKSMHKRASIYNDPLHKAIWDLHPAKRKGNYKCAKCHTPADKMLISSKAELHKNATQLNEPISCQTCHTIKSIQKHSKANKNIYLSEKKTFFSADKEKKGTTLHYHDKRSFFGLFKTRVGSPYHDINYSNENFYNGNVCLGCHDHKQNSKGFMICDMEIKEDKNSKNNCITCHMPKLSGSFVTLHDSKKHRFHGPTALLDKPSLLSQYIDITMKKEPKGFSLYIKNHANHTLAMQPLRLAQLRVNVERNGKQIVLPIHSFRKVLGHEGKQVMPWLATEILEDSTIKAFETREITFNKELKKGDTIYAQFGYYIVNPAMVTKLGIKDSKLEKFVILKKEKFSY